MVVLDDAEMVELQRILSQRMQELLRQGTNAADAFAQFDTSSSGGASGTISRREFREASRQLGLPLTEATLRVLMDRCY
jgi:hypothetical protein